MQGGGYGRLSRVAGPGAALSWPAVAGITAVVVAAAVYSSAGGPGAGTVELLVKIGGAPLLAYVALRVAHARRRQMSAFAARLGWEFEPHAAGLGPAAGVPGHPFERGSNGHVHNLCSGTVRGVPVALFDLVQSERQLGDRRAARYTCFLLRLPAPLPAFEVRPEWWVDRVGDAFGGTDLTLESEAFNRAFRVRAHDARAVTAILHPRVMEALLAAGPFAFGCRGWVVAGVDAAWADPERLLPRIDALAYAVTAVPPFVWRDHSTYAAGWSRS